MSRRYADRRPSCANRARDERPPGPGPVDDLLALVPSRNVRAAIARWAQDPEFVAAYEATSAEFDAAQREIDARREDGQR